MPRRPYLDGLRALAVLSVVVFHGFPSVLPGGFVGVDVFFVLSGFLITTIIAAEIGDGSFRLANFYARRIRRLLPAGFFVYVMTFIFAFLVLEPQQLKEFGRSLRAAALFISNYFFASRIGYFDAPAGEQPLLHTWSLAIEEQFYIAWPLLLMVLLRWLSGTWRTAIMLLALTLSLAYADVTARTGNAAAFFSLPARGWELLLGAALALAIDRIAFDRISAAVMAAAGLLGIGASCIFLNEATVYPGLSLLPACAGTCMVIASGFHQQTAVSKLLSHPAVVFVGLVSYSFYLWHWPMLVLARIYVERPLGLLETGMLIATSFGLSALTWRFVEQPFRSGEAVRLMFPPRTTIAVGVACTAVIVALSLAASRNESWLWRLDSFAQSIYRQQSSLNPYLSRCDGNARIFADDEFCNLGVAKPAGASYDFAIFGDSNAGHWTPAYAVLAKQQGLSGRQVTQSICAPLPGVDIHVTDERRSQCLVYQKLLVRFVKKNPKLRLAVLSANWLAYQGPLGHNELARLPSAPAADAGVARRTSLEDHLLATVRYLRSRGVKVHLIGQIPHQRIRSRCLLASLRAGEDGRQCAIAADAARLEIASSNDLFRRIAAQVEGVTATLPVDFMCDEERCPIYRDGTLLYRDYGHLSAAGAALLASHVRLPLP